MSERRAAMRWAPAATRWAPNATLRPGHEVVIVNLAARGLLVRTSTRLLPGKRVELQLVRDGKRQPVAGNVMRCRVVGLTPMCYEAAIAVEEGLTMREPKECSHSG